MATNLQALRSGQQNNAVEKPVKTIFDFLTNDPKIEKAIAAVATQFLTPDRFLRLAVNAVKKTPLLMQCDPQSVLGAFMTSASLGLEPNTVLQQAFLIPYKRRQLVNDVWTDVYDCQFQIGARGFRTLAYRSPYITKMEAEAIHEGDLFEHMQGSEAFLKYRKELKNRGELIGSFSYVKLASGEEVATVLPLDEIHKIRSRSETYNALVRKLDEASNAKDKLAAEKKLAETPWVMWADDMATKSAIKKGAKQWPITPDDALSAATVLDSDDDRVIDMATMADPDHLRDVMKNGMAPDEIPSLTDSPSPTFTGSITGSMARQAEVIDVVAHQQQTTQQAKEELPPEISKTEKVKERLMAASDLDLLDAEADLIRELPQDDQKGLKELYKARRSELSGSKPVPRRQMSID